MKRKTSQTKPLYAPPRLTVVGSLAGLTTRVTDLACDPADGAPFSLEGDEPRSCNVPLLLH